MKIQPAVRQRRKEIRDEAKRILLGKVLYHPYFPHDIHFIFGFHFHNATKHLYHFYAVFLHTTCKIKQKK